MTDDAADRVAADAAAEEEKKRGFRIEVVEGKVLLTVLAGEKDPRLLGKIRMELVSRGFLNVDEETVRAAAEARAEKPVELGMHVPKDAVIEVDIPREALEARVRIFAPETGGKMATADAIRHQLQSAGVKEGIDEALIARLAERPIYGDWVAVAKGRPVVPGKDGWVEYHFSTEKKVKLAVDEETGSVDHHELGLVENCVEGQLLATLRSPEDGSSGVTVRGEYLPSKQGKAGRMIPGKNVVVSADGKELHAGMNGHVFLTGDRVTVSPVFTVSGSVGPQTGNIHFVGSVEVTGGVEDGYKIQATERVAVGKTIGKAEIDAGGDIEIRGGMAGHGEGKLHAGGDIRVRFLQEATVDARGAVYVSEAVMHSTVESGTKIFVGVGPVESKKGVVVGGLLRAFQEVNCRTLGTPMATKTNVEVGVNPKILRRVEELTGMLKKEKENFDKVRKGVLTLKALSAKMGGLPDDKEKILSTLTGAHESLRAQIARISEELQELEAQAQVKVAGRVSVAATAHSGVRIQIGSSSYYLTESFDFTTFTEDAAEIKKRPYEAPPKKENKPK